MNNAKPTYAEASKALDDYVKSKQFSHIDTPATVAKKLKVMKRAENEAREREKE